MQITLTMESTFVPVRLRAMQLLTVIRYVEARKPEPTNFVLDALTQVKSCIYGYFFMCKARQHSMLLLTVA